MIRPIPGFEGYRVTDSGHVWSMKSKRWLKPQSNPRSGKLGVALYVNGRRHDRPIHALVALTFIGPRPEGLVIRHLNGNHTDNRVSNLTYGTHSENVLDQVQHGVHNMTSKTKCKYGHPYTEESTYPQPGGRACRTCRNEASRRYRARKAGKA